MTTPPSASHGLGGLVTTEVERITLGMHHGRALHARVERRSARFSAGRRWHLALTIGRTRPVAIEVSAPGEQYDLPIVTTDPWVRATTTLAAVSVPRTGPIPPGVRGGPPH